MKRLILVLGLVFSSLQVGLAAEEPTTATTEVQDTLKTASSRVLVELIQQAEKAGDFIKEQVPIVLKELLAWNLAQDLVLGFLCLAIVGICCWGTYYDLTHRQEGMWMFAAIAGMFLAFPAFINLMDAIKITMAPRVWLLEYAAHLVK